MLSVVLRGTGWYRRQTFIMVGYAKGSPAANPPSSVGKGRALREPNTGRWSAARGARVRRRLLPMLFFAPITFYVFAFFVYPLVYSILMSVENFGVQAMLTGSGPFVGLQNYAQALSDSVTVHALVNTAIFTVASVLLQNCVGVGLALLLSKKFLLSNFLRRFVLVPWLLPAVAAGTIFYVVFGAPVSLANTVLQDLHVISSPLPWLTDYRWEMTALILVNIWAGLPFTTLVYYSAIQDMDPVLFEAAQVDGARGWQRFRYITLGLLKPVIAIVVMLGLIYTVKVFDIVIIMTGGGPNNATQLLSTWSFTLAFTDYNFGQAAAIANILLAVSLFFSIFYLRTLRKERV